MSDNVLGMYDVMSKTFFTNVGTGTFIAGPNTSITGTIYDCSGYNNNGIVTGALAAIAGSPRYGIATYGPTDSYILCNQKLILINPNQFTISFWIKATTNGYFGFLCQYFFFYAAVPFISRPTILSILYPVSSLHSFSTMQ